MGISSNATEYESKNVHYFRDQLRKYDSYERNTTNSFNLDNMIREKNEQIWLLFLLFKTKIERQLS